jgi:hypothetical protein
MKSIRVIVTAFSAVFAVLVSFAQSHDHSQMTPYKTETFKVRGNCDMCKARIENAAKIEGVNKADWKADTKILTLVYNPSVVKTDVILKKVAEVGHDTEKFKSSEETYKKLPGCCKYVRESKPLQ